MITIELSLELLDIGELWECKFGLRNEVMSNKKDAVWLNQRPYNDDADGLVYITIGLLPI